MSKDIDSLMLPEDALNKAQKPEAALLGLDVASYENIQSRYGFKVGDIGILINEDTLCEVMKNFHIFPIPNTQAWMKGIVNLRGNLIPAYDLALLLGLSDEPIEYENLLIIDKGHESVGILINNVPRSCDVDSWTKLEHIPELPAELSEHVSDAYLEDGFIWLGFRYKEFFESMVDGIAC